MKANISSGNDNKMKLLTMIYEANIHRARQYNLIWRITERDENLEEFKICLEYTKAWPLFMKCTHRKYSLYFSWLIQHIIKHASYKILEFLNEEY